MNRSSARIIHAPNDSTMSVALILFSVVCVRCMYEHEYLQVLVEARAFGARVRGEGCELSDLGAGN